MMIRLPHLHWCEAYARVRDEVDMVAMATVQLCAFGSWSERGKGHRYNCGNAWRLAKDCWAPGGGKQKKRRSEGRQDKPLSRWTW